MKPYTIIATAVIVAAACGTARAQGVALNGKNANGEVYTVYLDSYYYGADALDSILLRVNYDVAFCVDTVKGTEVRERTTLEIGRNVSKYYNFDYFKADSLMKYNITQPPFCFNHLTDNIPFQGSFLDMFFMNYPEGKVTCTGRVMTQDFLYGEDIPEIEWTLGDSAKTILGYRCHTATCSFRGRDYTVWYTTDIPARYGPWKFSGLPGLVLEACDSDSLFTFKACKIYRTTGSIDMPKYTFLKAKKEQYMKAKKLQFVNLAQACRLYLVNTGWKMVEDGKPDKIKEMKWSFIERD